MFFILILGFRIRNLLVKATENPIQTGLCKNEDLLSHVFEKSSVTISSGKALNRSSMVPDSSGSRSHSPHLSIFWLYFLLCWLYSLTDKIATSNLKLTFYQLSGNGILPKWFQGQVPELNIIGLPWLICPSLND